MVIHVFLSDLPYGEITSLIPSSAPQAKSLSSATESEYYAGTTTLRPHHSARREVERREAANPESQMWENGLQPTHGPCQRDERRAVPLQQQQQAPAFYLLHCIRRTAVLLQHDPLQTQEYPEENHQQKPREHITQKQHNPQKTALSSNHIMARLTSRLDEKEEKKTCLVRPLEPFPEAQKVPPVVIIIVFVQQAIVPT